MDDAGAASEGVATVRDAVHRCLGEEPRGVEPLAGQLGLRRFFRVRLAAGRTLIARVEAPEDAAGRPPGTPPEPPLEPIRALLEGAGLPVPARLGADEGAGIELLEDFGSLSLHAWVATATDDERRSIYTEACELVTRLQRVRDPGGVAAFGRRLDAEHFAYKAELLSRWVLAERGRAATPAERAAVAEAFARVAREAARAPQRLAHRDLQSANLMVRGAPPRLGMIDLQGALLAPPEYDLVCLLRDSYVELPDDEIALHLSRTRHRLPDAPEPEAFARRFDLLTLTRKGKDCARFFYAARTRGDERFLRYVPSTLRALRAAARRACARDPQLEPLAELVHGVPERPCGR